MSLHARSRLSLRTVLALTTILYSSIGLAAVAHADDMGSDLQNWFSATKFSGHAEGGIAFNTAAPSNNENYGSLFTDHANEPQMNQLFLTAERDVDSSVNEFQVGYKLQGAFGTDMRYTHSLAETDHLIHSRYQFDFNEASVSLHVPSESKFLEGGVDVKLGQFPSPMGAESIDATQNTFYSHSYLFNFGVPFKSTGVLATAHVNPIVDLYAGLDTGVNGGITADGDNNKNIKGLFGFGLNNLMDGKLTILALSHVGTEDPPGVVPTGAMRYLNDVTATYKANDDWTFVTDVNYIEEDSNDAIGYGLAQYATYTVNDQWSVSARGEVYRDNSGTIVGAFPGYFDNANAQRGLPNTSYTVPRTTYSELTVGATYKVAGLPKAIDGTMIRPELRVDHALNGTKAFNGDDTTSFTPAVDVVVPF